ncbi:hypothetical protein CR513_40926, partial [Mucuna pruriens]
MDDPLQGTLGSFESTQKRINLRELTLNRSRDHKTLIQFYQSTCNPIRKNTTQFESYVANLAQSKVNIAYKDWDHVEEVLKNMI